MAAAFVVHEDRTDLQSLADLEGVRIAAGTPYSVDGWLAALGEIQARGYDPEHFFSETIFLQFPFPDIVRSLMKGSADVGVIPACMLERLESVGALEKGLLRVVHEQTSPELACRRSSALYPDWVVASMGTASPEDVRQVSIGLLTMPNTNDFEWWAAGDFRALNELYRTLRLGPYAFLRDFSVHAVIERYKGPLLFAAALMVLFLLNELRVHVLVRRRTKELSDALMERDANAQSIRELQKQLGEVERVGAVSQLSSMIAHELKQPVASIINFSARFPSVWAACLKRTRNAQPDFAPFERNPNASQRSSPACGNMPSIDRCLPRRVPCRQLSAKQCLFIETAKAGVFRWR